MKLTQQSLDELRQILAKQFGENIKFFSDKDIEKLGLRFLKLTSIILKK